MTVSNGSISAGFRLLAWLFPVKPLGDVSSLGLDQLRLRYASRDRWLNWAGFLGFVALACVGFLVIRHAANAHYLDLGVADFLIRPHAVEWAVWAAFLSLVSIMPLVLLALRLTLGKREYETYLTYCGHNLGGWPPLNIARVFRMFFWLLFAPLAVFTALRVDHHTAFYGDRMRHSPLWSFGRLDEHSYAEIRNIYEVRFVRPLIGSAKESPFQVIVHGDGTRWKTSQSDQRAFEAVRFVAARSGRQVGVVNFIEDIPP